jgi:hypothetical protein
MPECIHPAIWRILRLWPVCHLWLLSAANVLIQDGPAWLSVKAET